MKRIQNIGLPYAIITYKTIDLRRKIKKLFRVVFEIDE
jgi:hypothetical protein